MSEKKKNDELALTNERAVSEQYQALMEQLKQLKAPTDDGIDLNINFQDTRISSVTKVGSLIEIGSAVRGISTAYNTFRKEKDLGDHVADWSHNGKNAEEWDAIIDKAIRLLVNKAKAEKIERVLPKLESRLPKEERDRIEFEQIMSEAESKIE